MAATDHSDNFDSYQEWTEVVAKYPDVNTGSALALAYTALGLTGEAGEFADKVKKILRDSDFEIEAGTRVLLAKELGDVLWYLARAAKELGYDLSDIAYANILKLEDRLTRNKIGGSGDER